MRLQIEDNKLVIIAQPASINFNLFKYVDSYLK